MIQACRVILRHLAVIGFILIPAGAFADSWKLANDNSTINFVTVKNNSVAEIHHFDNISGQISSDGQGLVAIELDSVNTTIPIRDQRMKSLLFETTRYPQATISAKIEPNTISALKPGDRVVLPTILELDLHGVKKSLTSQLNIVAGSRGRLFVNTISPIIINVGEYNLIKGVNKLREIAKLSSIDTSVLVSVQLEFKR